MKQEDKELLIKDLSARLPYGTQVYAQNDIDWYDSELCTQVLSDVINDDYVVKPYLFPLSSMTEEQNKELSDILFDLEMEHLQDNETGFTIKGSKVAQTEIDWFNKNHFDYRGLIPMGLANDATNLNVY